MQNKICSNLIMINIFDCSVPWGVVTLLYVEVKLPSTDGVSLQICSSILVVVVKCQLLETSNFKTNILIET